jgi:DNA-3-methyladenine glycosylase
MNKIPKSFYLREDVIQIAKDLLGKYIFTNIDNKGITGGIIIETEAYAGVADKASHAYGDRRTQRTEIMYMEGGVAYVYLCYGIHSLFNVVTNRKNIPHAVLIRGIKPVDGLEIMQKRSDKKNINQLNGIGPGNVSKLLGIHFSHSGESLTGNKIWLEDRGLKILSEKVMIGKRVGVDYAQEDALLPYRFRISL